jgi:hypothetical protein
MQVRITVAEEPDLQIIDQGIDALYRVDDRRHHHHRAKRGRNALTQSQLRQRPRRNRSGDEQVDDVDGELADRKENDQRYEPQLRVAGAVAGGVGEHARHRQ